MALAKHIACGRRKTACSPVWDLFVRLRKPLLNDDYAISGPHHRLDVSFAAHGGLPANGPPHGLIGQSFATPGVARNGAVDVYPWEGEFTTRAQAEGAIEGAADMYEVASPYETTFAFSVFDAAMREEPLASAHDATSAVDASSIERSPHRR